MSIEFKDRLCHVLTSIFLFMNCIVSYLHCNDLIQTVILVISCLIPIIDLRYSNESKKSKIKSFIFFASCIVINIVIYIF